MCLLCGTVSACAEPVTDAAAASTVQVTDAVSRIVLTRDKTITVIYDSSSAVPATYLYAEYDSTLRLWYRGSLEYVSGKKVYVYVDGSRTAKWEATFSGTLYAQG